MNDTKENQYIPNQREIEVCLLINSFMEKLALKELELNLVPLGVNQNNKYVYACVYRHNRLLIDFLWNEKHEDLQDRELNPLEFNVIAYLFKYIDRMGYAFQETILHCYELGVSQFVFSRKRD